MICSSILRVRRQPEILHLLQQHAVKATFFCIGKRIPGNESILQQIKEDGHIIGNHSYSHHFWFDMFSSKKMLQDLRLMDEEVERVAGVQPKLFRPPYGVTNPNLSKAITSGGYTPIGWSVRSMDTVIKDERKLLAKINKGLHPGAVFLFHDTISIYDNHPGFLIAFFCNHFFQDSYASAVILIQVHDQLFVFYQSYSDEFVKQNATVH